MRVAGPEVVRAADRWQARHDELVEALSAAGVDLDAEDRAALEWIASWEGATVGRIVSWLARAHRD